MQATFAQPIKTNSNRFTIPQRNLAPARNADLIEAPHVETKDNKALIDALTASKIYQDYERAFSEMTGLPVTLRSIESWQLPHHGKRYENPFCAMMAQKSKTCAACLRLQQKLSDEAQHEPKTMACELGLCDTAVPIRLGDKLIGFLQTGQVFRSKPTEAQFKKTTKLLSEWGVELDPERLRENFFNTKVLPPRQYEAMVKLLTIFAQHVSMISNQILVHKENSEPPLITRAKQYIDQKQSEDISLTEVAKAVNTSTFYFCKMFKKATGLHFTEYVSRVRIEKAKNLLLNPNLRISEVAYEIGFQSLTHFNRVFKQITGQSPTEFRNQLA
jgi:YesN/AraC family two-component response regulator